MNDSIILISLNGCSSSRTIREKLEKNNIPFTLIRAESSEPMLLKMYIYEALIKSRNGFEDIVSDRSESGKKFLEICDDMTTDEAVEYLVADPSAMRSPIVINNEYTVVGYSRNYGLKYITGNWKGRK